MAILASSRQMSTLPHTQDLSPGQYTGSEMKGASSSRPKTCSRPLGLTETSYFLPSREDGVNDMYLHLGFTAPPRLTTRARVGLVWAILRLRHPLLASHVKMYNYDNIQFEYTFPASADDVLREANANLEYRNDGKDDLIDAYLNGPRTLSNVRLSYLIISPSTTLQSVTPPPTPSDDTPAFDFGSISPIPHDLLVCATHFLGDGMSLHQFANDFFSLLGCGMSGKQLREMLENQWQAQRCQGIALPSPLEDRLPDWSQRTMSRAAGRVDFQNIQDRQIGGQSFPKKSGKPRHTIVPTIAIDVERTKKMLKACKSNGVSISSALFALCNIAWARATNTKGELPTLMYSALNLRPNLRTEKSLSDSYWFLAIGYFNIILPAFVPSSADVAKIFWHRARVAKAQSTIAAKSPMLTSRSRFMAEERGTRAKIWAREDDEKAQGIWTPPPTPKTESAETQLTQLVPKPPSTALMGLSLLGNLDSIYKHADFGEVDMDTLTTGSRQRCGGMLLFGYTFAGKLWVSLGYDENGFEPTQVKNFWDQVTSGLDEFLDA